MAETRGWAIIESSDDKRVLLVAEDRPEAEAIANALRQRGRTVSVEPAPD